MSLGEVIIGILGLLLLIGYLGCLKNLIYKSLVSVAVSGLVLSLGIKNANVIHEDYKFAQPGPVLLITMRPFYRVDRSVRFFSSCHGSWMS
jgi:hypothetical protein